jgi:collagen alpha-1(XXV) chain (CLAC-P) (alzheimer disease amyloid- associated protein) (AMY) [contains: collagen-like alzheimer amyloid plaque component (CLAC)].
MADSTLTLKLDKDSIFNLLEGLRGPRGEKGEDGQRGERGEKGEQGLRGPKGEPASAERAAELLKQKNVYLPDASVETVLAKLVELFGDSINVTYKPIEYIQPLVGQAFIDLRGEPHFKVSVDGGEKRVFESDNMRVPIEPFGVANILVKYYDLADREVGIAEIKGVEVHSNADDTFEENNVRYALFGRKLEVDVTNFTGTNALKVLGKWLVTQIDSILIKTSKKVNPVTREESFRDTNNNAIGDIPIIVENPQNVTFANRDNLATPIKIGTLQDGVSAVRFQSSQIEWSDSAHKYIGAGDAVDHL